MGFKVGLRRHCLGVWHFLGLRLFWRVIWWLWVSEMGEFRCERRVSQCKISSWWCLYEFWGYWRSQQISICLLSLMMKGIFQSNILSWFNGFLLIQSMTKLHFSSNLTVTRYRNLVNLVIDSINHSHRFTQKIEVASWNEQLWFEHLGKIIKLMALIIYLNQNICIRAIWIPRT